MDKGLKKRDEPGGKCRLAISVIGYGINIVSSPLLPMSVISTDHEGAKRLRASGEIPTGPVLPH
jgi:hypothetical protein